MTGQQIVNKLFERLTGDTFRGTAEELAAEIGVPLARVRNAISRTRRPAFIDANHWTIPYVQRGAWDNVWRVVDTEARANNEAMAISQDGRAAEMLRTVRRNVAQATLARAAVDGRSREARQWGHVVKMLTGAEGLLESLIED